MEESLKNLLKQIDELKSRNFQMEQEYFERLSNYSNCIQDLEIKTFCWRFNFFIHNKYKI